MVYIVVSSSVLLVVVVVVVDDVLLLLLGTSTDQELFEVLPLRIERRLDGIGFGTIQRVRPQDLKRNIR